MTPSFNLIDQPWIPCVSYDGELVELSLRDLFQAAPRLRAIHCEVPIMNAAVMPVLLAILHRVFGPENTRQWENLWSQGHFPAEPLNAYFEHWYERFDLFHPERPFYQARDDRAKPRSVIHLIQSIANTGALFTHADENVGLTLSPSAAARHLLTAQSFRTAGLSGMEDKFTDGLFSRGVLFWAQGTTLFDTLMFNLFTYPQERVMPWTPRDMPAWEMEDPFQVRRIPNGYLDYLTWQGKRMLLLPDFSDESMTVSTMTVAPGLTIDAEVRSPLKRYLKKVKDGATSWSFLYFNGQKALWRDYFSILPHDDTESVKPPYVVFWLARLDLGRDYPLRLSAIGMLADQAKPIFYRQEVLPLPPDLLHNGVHQLAVAEAIGSADETADKLRNAVNILADNVLLRGNPGKPDSGNRGNLTNQWDVLSLYWSELEPHFWTFVAALTAGDPLALDAWSDTLIRSAREALDRAEGMAGDSPWALKGGVAARRYLNTELKRLFPPQEEGVRNDRD